MTFARNSLFLPVKGFDSAALPATAARDFATAAAPFIGYRAPHSARVFDRGGTVRR